MKRFLLTTAALVAAVVVLTLATLPPTRISLTHATGDGTIPGVIHIHTNRSDGRSSPAEVATAAAAAGLKFIVFTDHGDATREPDVPVYRDGVLCIDAVEISTVGGHYVALGLPAAPYPIGGEPRDVVEDVHRLGGFGVAAHPDSPKPELAWRDWTAPFDGMEIINPDSGWRQRAAEPGVHPKLRLVERLFSYPIRPSETVASFVTGSPGNFAHWETLTGNRRVVGLAGADAHAKLALASSEPGDNRFSLALPGYQASFGTLSVHVMPAAPLSGNAAADAASVLRGVRAGHVFISVDGIASPPEFAFTAESAGRTVGEGDDLAAGAPVSLHVQSNAPPSFTTTLWAGNRVLGTSTSRDVTLLAAGDPSVYRVEIRATDRPRDPVWLVSNPIYVRGPERASAPPIPASSGGYAIFGGDNQSDWSIEHQGGSSGTVERATGEAEGALHWRYTLESAALAAHPAVALLRDLTDGLHGNTRVAFAARADRPMRVSVQLRTGAGSPPERRWQRSVYLDAAERDIVLPLNDFTAIPGSPDSPPALRDVGYLLFVVDATNTKPGSSGEIWIRRVALQK